MKKLVLYHGGCIDGFTAAWAVYRALGDIEAVPVHYNTPPLPDEQLAGRDVIIVDFSYPIEVFRRIRELAETVVMLDHHKSALKDLAPLLAETEPIDPENVRRSLLTEDDLYLRFDMDKSGAGLAWDHFSSEPRPWLIDYVEDRDLWTWRLPDSRKVSAFVNHQVQSFERWDYMAHAMTPEDARQSGAAAKDVVDHYVADTVKKARIYSIADHLVPVVNATYWHTSEVLEHLSLQDISVDAEEGMRIDEVTHHPDHAINLNEWVQPAFAMSWYIRPDGKHSYSLRSRDRHDGTEAFDVSALAKRFGGGGHHRAAGFAVSQPIHINALIKTE